MTRPVILHVAAVEFTASRLLLPQLIYLRELGYDVRLACAPEARGFAEELRNFNPVPLAFPRSYAPAATVRAALDLLRIVRSVRPALIHFHSPAASVPGRSVLALYPNRPRVVYTVHGFLHTWDAASNRDRMLNRAERFLSRWTDALLFQSTEDYDHARRAGYHGRLVTLGNGVGDEWFVTRPTPRPPGPLNVVFVGRLTREKGVADLLDAVHQVPDIRWTIVGGALSSDREPVADAVASCAAVSGGRVDYVGMVPADRVRTHLIKADLLVLPSWREGLPRSVIEGMAAGLPIIATDIRGCRELVEPGVTGWLIPVRDPRALADAVKNAAALPAGRLAVMGAAGRARAWDQYREHRVFKRIVAVYRALSVAPT